MPAFVDLSGLLAGTSTEALLVTTPPHHHEAPTTEGLSRGLHVLVEKPMATSSAEAGRMLAAARRERRQLMVGFNRRYRPSYEVARRRLSSRPPTASSSIDHRLWVDANWQRIDRRPREQRSITELLDDVASHQLDLLPHLLSRPIERMRVVRSVDRGPRGSYVEYELDFGDGLRARCVAGYGPRYRERLTVAGGQSCLVGHPGGVFETRLGSERWIDTRARLGDAIELLLARLTGRPNQTLRSFAAQLDAFAAAVVGGDGDPARADGAAGMRAVQAIEALRTSLEENGTWISLQ